ncbi:MAG: FAD-dependent oxidoreductase [Magnetococcales bacterium]|nr:FAD-dependent oxidoreductase [Magnetococcales bacterium]MBF0439661.1 FAD-dependent oxidoreductase [Magnetococcales bacterium]
MTMSNFTRRSFVKLTGGVAALGLVSMPSVSAFAAAKKRVVVIGGGYGGSIAAKYIRMGDPNIQVTLIEQNKDYYSGPLSNWVITGLRKLEVQKWGYEGLKKHGVEVVIDQVNAIDPAAKTVGTVGGKKFEYDRLIVSPGVGFKSIEGYDAEAEKAMPHAWNAGEQTTSLAKKLQELKDGDPFILVAPPDPYRCPPGPYERASLVADYLKKNKPKSKVIILDPKDKFSKMPLFTGGWKQLYGYETPNSLIEWIPGAQGGKVTRVDAKAMTVYTEMAEFKSSCINIIPPNKAGAIAEKAGLTDDKGFCPVNLETFESTKHPGIHVIGDASAAPGLPKSGYAANSEAKVCAAAVVNILNGRPVGIPSYVNTCYSLISPDYGISVAGVYKLNAGKIVEVSGGVSPGTAEDTVRKQEAVYNESWYQSIMADTFG